MPRARMFVLFLASILLAGCGSIPITGSGNVVTQEEAITGFDKVDISYSFEANISQGNTFRVVIRADDNLVEYLQVVKEGDRLQTEWQIDDSLLDTEVPALCLQPLVENAIYHGIEPIEKGGKIHISALHINNKLILSVSNPLMSEKQSSAFKKGNQMAQDNIKQRLKLVYGNSGKFIINDTKDNYTVSLMIPLDVMHERIDS